MAHVRRLRFSLFLENGEVFLIIIARHVRRLMAYAQYAVEKVNTVFEKMDAAQPVLGWVEYNKSVLLSRYVTGLHRPNMALHWTPLRSAGELVSWASRSKLVRNRFNSEFEVSYRLSAG